MDKTKKTKIIKRIFFSILLILSVFLLPWWAVLVFSVTFVVFFEKPYEAIIAGGLLDSLYGAPFMFFARVDIFFTIVFLLIFIVSYYVKEKLMI